jgi:peptidoglycan/LPS O-acetylase OafA/YrhL
LAGALVTYAVALLSYRWYESHFLKLKERWSRRTVGPIRRADELHPDAGTANIAGAPSLAIEQQLSGAATVAMS